MKKKGSLALSTNAIVVLIIAITILGLALAFTRNIFKNLGSQIEDIGKQTLVENPPSYDKPFTLSKAEFDLRKGKSVSLGAGFYNKYDQEKEATVGIYSCYRQGEQTYDSQGSPSDNSFVFTEPGPKVTPINEDVSFSTSIKAKPTARSGIHSCTLMVTATRGPREIVYQDILINIK